MGERKIGDLVEIVTPVQYMTVRRDEYDSLLDARAELARLRAEVGQLRAALAEIVQVDRNGYGDAMARRRMAHIAAAGLDAGDHPA